MRLRGPSNEHLVKAIAPSSFKRQVKLDIFGRAVDMFKIVDKAGKARIARFIAELNDIQIGDSLDRVPRRGVGSG